MANSTKQSKIVAYKFLILLGVVSFFADMTYESARSINGQFLESLGANAAIVGTVAGFGELVGYALRMLSGYLAEKTGRYWTIVFVGYILNLCSIPLLALAGYWQIATVLILIERFGKALRTPVRDAMLSHAGHEIGFGWAFGLEEALDQAGAMLGPLVIALMLLHKTSYNFCFAVLAIPAFLALLALFVAYIFYPNPRSLEVKKLNIQTRKVSHAFWLYVIGAALIAAGYADFSLMAYHFTKTNLLAPSVIPFSYAAAMGITAITAPIFGYYYDRIGFLLLILVTLIAILFAPLVFLGNEFFAILGVLLWGVGMGSNETLMRAVVANMTSADKRSSAYGIFNLGYGIAWFLGSAILGVLYDLSIPAMVTFSVIIQLSAMPILFKVMQLQK